METTPEWLVEAMRHLKECGRRYCQVCPYLNKRILESRDARLGPFV